MLQKRYWGPFALVAEGRNASASLDWLANLLPFSSKQTEIVQFEVRVDINAVSALEGLSEPAEVLRAWPEGNERALRNGARLYYEIGSQARWIRDVELGHFSLDFTENTPRVQQLSRAWLKWSLIARAEAQGFVYFHASAVRCGQRVVLFCAPPHFGKSTCFARMVNAGAEPLSDDSFLASPSGIVAWDFEPTLKAQSEARGLTPELCRRLAQIPAAFLGGAPAIDHIVFPRIWTGRESWAKALPRTEAISILEGIYQQEASWNSLAQASDLWRERLESLIVSTQFSVFYAAANEAEANAQLQQLLAPRE